ncbi:MAG: hypothetical protein NZ739_10070 [Verrucomicrobiae bacterium]|nr:hypothetical protein [Verrucomicrobiae bacterium]MDW7979011.1 hypothetical protein [Verrucomicrobiales bacterium]
MTKISESKRALRRRLASLPIKEKLAMLDALRERTLALRRARRAPPAELVARRKKSHDSGTQ